jgi:hypothetical protein
MTEKNLCIRTQKSEKSDRYNNSGVYQLKYSDCNKKCVGQARRNFAQRYKGYIKDIRYNKIKLVYSQHILETGHCYGRMEDIMDTLQINNERPFLYVLEQFYILHQYQTTRILTTSTVTYTTPFTVVGTNLCA